MTVSRSTSPALVLAAAVLLALAPSAARAQFTNETPIETNGVRIWVRPSVSISTTSQGVVRVTLDQIHARIDRDYGVLVDGQRFP